MTEIAPGALAGRWRRLGGYTVDTLVVSGPFILLAQTSAVDDGGGTFGRPLWFTVAGAVTGLLYEVLLTARDGQTIGKKLMRTRVVSLATLSIPSLRLAAIRALPQLLGLVPIVRTASILIYAPVAWREDRRGVHDHLARTVVVSSDY